MADWKQGVTRHCFIKTQYADHNKKGLFFTNVNLLLAKFYANFIINH